jgi:flavin-dependent dehydrogenase
MRPIAGMTVTGPGPSCVAADYPDRLVAGAIMRRDLDLALLDAAIGAGAEFMPQADVREPAMRDGRVTSVIVQRAGRRYTMPARIIIAADGRGSRLGSRLGLTAFAAAPRRWAFGAYFANVDGLTSHGEMHIRCDGYVGVAPVTDNITNVCVVRAFAPAGRGFLSRQAGHGHPTAQGCAAGTPGEGPHPADNEITRAISRDPVLRERFARAEQVSSMRTLGPLAVAARAAGCPGLLLAGDAAGFVDPMTGDGLRFALRGGELAAEAALCELASATPAHDRLWQARVREFSGKWRVNRALRSLVGSPRAVGLAAKLASRWPAPVRLLINMAGDVNLARESTN